MSRFAPEWLAPCGRKLENASTTSLYDGRVHDAVSIFCDREDLFVGGSRGREEPLVRGLESGAVETRPVHPAIPLRHALGEPAESGVVQTVIAFHFLKCGNVFSEVQLKRTESGECGAFRESFSRLPEVLTEVAVRIVIIEAIIARAGETECADGCSRNRPRNTGCPFPGRKRSSANHGANSPRHSATPSPMDHRPASLRHAT